MRELFISFILVTTFSIVNNTPPLQPVQAGYIEQDIDKPNTTKASEASQKKKVGKKTNAKKKTPQQAPKQAQVVSQPIVTARPAAVPITGSCSEWMSAAGISDPANAAIIFQKESNCNPLASNPSSAAHGVCQSLPASKMASAGADYMTNPVTQMKWCESYAIGRYGSWAKAVAFWQLNHWW